ncbi:hypothetical protein [Pseudonocardia humida]|uniref:hypothetical protein n=1 Tax=Pseudonocardia humida TaxID=2800819 RepID=UPI00207D146C|nr:hypothetical protein [Pseudonocardia humida]
MAALLGVLAFGVLLSGCSAATPLCDQAATLLAQGRPLDAMALYARADAQDEGNCAGNGISAAGERIGQAAAEEARGAAAEQVGDTAAAAAAYQAALDLNAGDARAAAGLVRLGQPAGTPPPAQIPPLPQPVEPTGWWRAEWPLLVGAGLLALALLAAGYALVSGFAVRRKVAAVPAAAPAPVAETAADRSEIEALRRRADGAADVLAERCTALEGGVARLEATIARRDRLLEVLAGQLSGPPAVGVQREQLFVAPQRPEGAPGEGSGVVDVQLVAVSTADGTRRTIAHRVRWTPPDDRTAAALVARLGTDPIALVDVLATGTVTPAWARSTELWLLPPASRLAADLGLDTGTAAEPGPGSLEALVSGGAIRTGQLTRLTAETAPPFAPDASVAFLARLVTVFVGGSWTNASLTSEAHEAASEIAAAALEAATGLADPVSTGSTGRTPSPPAELDRILGRPTGPVPGPRPPAPVTVRVVAAPPRADDRRPDGPVAEGGVLRLRTTYRIDRVEVDAVGVLRALGRPASDAARTLVANPADDDAVEAFRAAVRPTGDRAGGPALGCDVLAVGDDEIGFTYRVGTARLDVAALLAGSAELTRAFAEQVGSVRSGGDRRPFDAALRETVRPEHLGAIAAGLPGRSPVLVMEAGRRDAVDTRYAPAGEAPAPAAGSDAHNGADMYQALAVNRAQPAEPDSRPAARRRRTAGPAPRREPNGSGGPGR